KKLGTLELLFIKPVSLRQTVFGKFLGTFVLALMALLPTLLYVYTVSRLGTTVGNLDMGLVGGSYFGLIFLMACYTAIGLFTSTLSENQIVAFLLGLVVCFLMYYGFEGLSTVFQDGTRAVRIQNLGMKWHFERVARGVLDIRDLIYFVSVTAFFLFLCVEQLKNSERR
ncbi:MAG: ABC transporter permease subunit, partial [Pricia sp.]